VIYHHPLAYLIGVEGLALLRAWAGEGDRDEAFVRRRIDTVRRLLDDPELAAVPGVTVEQDATGPAYAQWAPSYDDPDNGLFALDAPIIDEILDGLSVGSALDAGCGTGRLAQRLAGRGYQVSGVDGSAAMLAAAKERLPDGQFAEADLTALPLPDAAVDLVVSGLALTHVPTLGPVYAEFARVLRPGGDLVVSDVHADLVLLGSTVKATGPGGEALLAATHRHSTGDHLRAALAAGFTVRRCDDHPRPAPVTTEAAGPADEPSREIGDWRSWPWPLLGWDPEASRSAWNNPAITVWHFRRSAAR
jgi:SAM-dependent methyltransferase